MNILYKLEQAFFLQVHLNTVSGPKGDIGFCFQADTYTSKIILKHYCYIDYSILNFAKEK